MCFDIFIKKNKIKNEKKNKLKRVEKRKESILAEPN